MTNARSCAIIFKQTKYAGMAELADALDSGSSRVPSVQVQVLLPALKRNDNFLKRKLSFLFVLLAFCYLLFTKNVIYG